jgi:hypothetical protein
MVFGYMRRVYEYHQSAMSRLILYCGNTLQVVDARVQRG